MAMIPTDVLPRILEAQLEETRQLVARRRELRQKIEEAAMRGRVQAALDTADVVTNSIPEICACLRGPRDLEEFMRSWLQSQLTEEGSVTPLSEWRELALAMGVPEPVNTFAEAQQFEGEACELSGHGAYLDAVREGRLLHVVVI